MQITSKLSTNNSPLIMTGKILQGPKLDFTPNATMGEFFFDSAKKYADRTCQIDDNIGAEETFASLSKRSTKLALTMLDRGITPDDVIVVCSNVTLDTPVPILASFYVAAKITNLDPTLSVRQTAHLLGLVSPRMVFVEEASVELIERSLEEAKLETEIVVFGESNKYERFSSLVKEHPGEENFRPIKVTCLFLAPVLTYELTNFSEYDKYDISSLHTLITGGTSISNTQIDKVTAIFPQANFIICYGLSEIGIVSLFNIETDAHLIRVKVGSAGKVAHGCYIKIVDIETRQILGPNQKGEICLKSASLMEGYYNMDSSSVFDEDGFLKSGDIGYYDEDGCLYIVDRIKEMFKYLSWHIVPSAIEQVLYEHEAVKQAVVFGLPKNEEVGDLPAACVILKNNSVTEKELEEFVAGKVSDREKLRGGVYFVEKFFRTPTGKIIRSKIRDHVLKMLNESK